MASATENHSISFHQYHLEDTGRVRYRKICEIEDRQVDQRVLDLMAALNEAALSRAAIGFTLPLTWLTSHSTLTGGPRAGAAA
ncbi:hypothetical protein ACFY5C_33545 [Streptomyces sp. NPDC012935]|uniref:hypothetical protein n=1 Tax=Streptomyces sp. NPDC012935 TaxID=3364857 RepID=UPI0036873996